MLPLLLAAMLLTGPPRAMSLDVTIVEVVTDDVLPRQLPGSGPVWAGRLEPGKSNVDLLAAAGAVRVRSEFHVDLMEGEKVNLPVRTEFWRQGVKAYDAEPGSFWVSVRQDMADFVSIDHPNYEPFTDRYGHDHGEWLHARTRVRLGDTIAVTGLLRDAKGRDLVLLLSPWKGPSSSRLL